jgi:hypothetical protein
MGYPEASGVADTPATTSWKPAMLGQKDSKSQSEASSSYGSIHVWTSELGNDRIDSMIVLVVDSCGGHCPNQQNRTID